MNPKPDNKMENHTSKVFNRARFLTELEQSSQWDIIIIGGGATGLGTALDAASRGYKTLLLEQVDFAKGTSSRSTKLVHGGVRYLAQGNIALVYEALRERGTLLANAAHLVSTQEFIIPCYNWASVAKYYAGLKLYDWLAGRLSLGKSRYLNKKTVLSTIPTIRSKNLVGGIRYYDGQFDDSRLAINIAQTAAEHGATVLNYFKVTALLKTDGMISGLNAVDVETSKAYALKAKVVINATGVFVDEILQLDQPKARATVRVSQGTHLVFDTSFLTGTAAIMIPKTSDGRVLFALPWHGQVLLGTTDTPVQAHSLEPKALQQEIDFILSTASEYLSRAPTKKDIRAVFAGLRPLAAPNKETGSTKEISRSHKITVTPSGLLTIFGGKWTTYRKMAEDTVNRAMKIGNLPNVACRTTEIQIHKDSGIDTLIEAEPTLDRRLSPEYPYRIAEVVLAIREEMARTVEDVLARRLRLLFLDARAAIDAAPVVAELMAVELGLDKDWQNAQVQSFQELAASYLVENYTKKIEQTL
jgi:glycerol-3-phosphate dehydrogenase